MKIPPTAIECRRFQKVSPRESLPGLCEAGEGGSICCEQCPVQCRAQQTHAVWVANLNRNVRTQPMSKCHSIHDTYILTQAFLSSF